MYQKLATTSVFLILTVLGFTQSNTQKIKGKVIDQMTGEPLIGATVVIEGSEPLIGTVTDVEGNYTLENVKLGRNVVVVSFIGYKQIRIPEILVTAAKPFLLDISLEDNIANMDVVVVTAQSGKEALNSMATVSARSFTIEESSRLAGGLSDPSRVAYNFAGVTFSSPQDNGVVIRGNSPSNVLWRLNGLDVSGAAHFGGGNLAGAGLISIYSANILRGSDFFTGAFPAEYANATAGVFDINFRKGNSEEVQHSAQLGLLGVDLSSEGPLSKGGKSSYLVNYRHGFIGYYGAAAGGTEPHYQDLSFNLNFPTEKSGEFSLWGIGGVSSIKSPFREYSEEFDEATNTSNIKLREYESDFLDSEIDFAMGAIGLNHKLLIGKSAFLSSNIGYTSTLYDNETVFFEEDGETLNTGTLHPHYRRRNVENKIEFASRLNSQLTERLSNRTGVRANLLQTESHSLGVDQPMDPLEEYFSIEGNTYSVNAFTQFKYMLATNIDLNVGLSSTKFGLANELTLEPRVGFKWQYLPFAQLGLAYGRHSKHEELKTYFYTNTETGRPNELRLSKADHYVASLGFSLSKNLSLTVEGYYQSLFDVPTIEGTSISFANYTTLWEVNGPITNNGTGRNVGVDLTLERVMDKGFYYLFTASVFDSKYEDAQQIKRNTLFNRNWITSLAVGKEFVVKEKNLLGINLNATYMGGGRLTPFLQQESLAAQDVIYDTDRLFEIQSDPEIWLNAGVTYKINKSKSTRTWGLDFQNALLTEQVAGYKYNFRDNTIDEDKVFFILPNLYYKIEF
ncbi:MAG: TonB-dependent receptor [Bacteroidota bacterium]